MRFEIPIRVTVERPMNGVAMQVQKGRHELLAPVSRDAEKAVFTFVARGVMEGRSPNFLGPFAHGPKGTRFIYVNSGTAAGDAISCWSRRAKISLMSITAEQIEEVLADPGCVLAVAINGSGKDGGPICASVRSPVWTVQKGQADTR